MAKRAVLMHAQACMCALQCSLEAEAIVGIGPVKPADTCVRACGCLPQDLAFW